MVKNALYYVLALIITCLCACSDGKTDNFNVGKDTVSLARISLTDTVGYMLSEKDSCKISANVEITYPTLFVDKNRTEVLQRIFAEKVLEVLADTLSLASAFPVYVEKLVGRYESVTIEEYQEEPDYEPVKNCVLNVKISAIYNGGGIVCFERIETSRLDDSEPETRSDYYMVDLTQFKRIGVLDLFAEEDLLHVEDMLKACLRANAGVESDDDLVDLGYYNIDNMGVNNNFYIDAEGITWCYPPRELSVLEEVKISLDYDMLRDFIKEKSVISQFIEK